MTTITGYVEKIWENHFPAKNGRKAFTGYSVVVDNTKYGTFKKPDCKEGDYVTFEAAQKGQYWNLDDDSLKKAEPPVNTPKPVAATGYGGKTPAVQDAINFQSARKDALVFVTLMKDLGILDLGKTKGKQVDVLELTVDKYTQRYFEDTKNLGHESSVESEEQAVDEDEFNDKIPY